MKAATFLKSFRVENFKAIQNSKNVKLTPLTVLIGNNGSGKSSFIEAMETYRTIVTDGLDEGMERWFGMQHVWNKKARHQIAEEMPNLQRLRSLPSFKRFEDKLK